MSTTKNPIEQLNGLYFIGTLSKKYTDKYTKDVKEYTNYNFKFDFLGGFQTFRVNKEAYDTLEIGVHYILPVGHSTKKEWDWTSFFLKTKSDDVLDSNFIKIILENKEVSKIDDISPEDIY